MVALGSSKDLPDLLPAPAKQASGAVAPASVAPGAVHEASPTCSAYQSLANALAVVRAATSDPAVINDHLGALRAVLGAVNALQELKHSGVDRAPPAESGRLGEELSAASAAGAKASKFLSGLAFLGRADLRVWLAQRCVDGAALRLVLDVLFLESSTETVAHLVDDEEHSGAGKPEGDAEAPSAAPSAAAEHLLSLLNMCWAPAFIFELKKRQHQRTKEAAERAERQRQNESELRSLHRGLVQEARDAGNID